MVILVVFDQKSFVLSEKLISGIDAFLEEHEVNMLADEEYGKAYAEELRRENAWRRRRQREQTPVLMSQALPAGKTLEEFVDREEDSFRDRLFRLIDERGLSDSEVYIRANLTRQVFSKIRNNPDYHPKKTTAFALSIALELDMKTMLDLLSRAGLTFSPGSRTDLIVEYFVTNENYDTGQIDAALFHYGQPTLFSEE